MATTPGGTEAPQAEDRQGFGGGEGFGGGFAAGRETAADYVFVRVTGGTLDVKGEVDGIDVNGDLYLDGGNVKINGQSQGMEGAVDLDGNFFIAGGTLVAAGSVMDISGDAEQPALLLSYTEQQAAGIVIALKDGKGDTLLEVKYDEYIPAFVEALLQEGNRRAAACSKYALSRIYG
ncbi:MAG: hypothetical protein LBS67_01845 [Clostridiales Family XIII bacterium]|nr:hypothetical protein [Clostridiales Family XIII bacterium]